MDDLTTAELIRRTGKALYGDRWRAALADDLNVTERTVRRWVAGDTTPPRGVTMDLLRLVHNAMSDLEALEPELRQRG